MPTVKHEGVKEKISKNNANSPDDEKENKKETKSTLEPQGTRPSKNDDDESDKSQAHQSVPSNISTITSTSQGGDTSNICSVPTGSCCEKSDEDENSGRGNKTSSRNKMEKNERTNEPLKTSAPSSSLSSSHKQQYHQQASHKTTSSSLSSFSNNDTTTTSNNEQRSNCTKLFCGSGNGSSESKRKEVDENNVNGSSLGNSETGSKWRKSSRKGSKKKDKNGLKEEAAAHLSSKLNITSDSVSGTSGDSNIQSGTCVNSANNNSSNNNSNSIENGGTTPPSSTTTTNQQSQQSGAHDRKSCCFCWCCCCSCSCLPGKNQNKTGKENTRIQPSTSLEHYFNGNSDPPSIEEMRIWSESFDKLMKCPWGRKVFRDFLKCEYSEENILFWLACEDLKNESNPEVIEEKARVIYEDYISILSPKEVSLDSRVREIINKNMVNPSPHTFDEAQLQIYTLMHRDSYPRFINSNMYRKLAQLPTSSRKGSTA